MRISVSILFVFFACSSFALTVDEILDKSEANDNFKTSYSVNTEEVYKSDGSVKISKMEGYSANGNEKTLMIYTEPKRISGMKILMLNDGDDIWFYSNRTNRVRKIASHQKKQSANGSDFSYDDMSMSDNRKDYNYSLSGEEVFGDAECYKIMFSAKNGDNSYSKFYIWIDKANFLARGGEFYDDENNLWKKLSVRGIEKKDGYWTASEVEMRDVQKDSRTVIRTEEIKFDIELDEDMFTERYLKR